MRAAFQPIGEVSKRKIVYDAVCDVFIGTTLTYEQLHNMTGLDIEGKDRETVYGANKWLLKNDNKMLVNNRKVGYVMALPTDQLKHAATRKTRARRQLSKGMLEATKIDISQLSPDERIRQVNLINHLATSLRTVRKRTVKTVETASKTKASAVEARKEIDAMLKQLTSLKGRLSE